MSQKQTEAKVNSFTLLGYRIESVTVRERVKNIQRGGPHFLGGVQTSFNILRGRGDIDGYFDNLREV